MNKPKSHANEALRRASALRRVSSRLKAFVPFAGEKMKCVAVVSLHRLSEERAVVALGQGAWTHLGHRSQVPEGTPLIDIVRALAALRLISVKDSEHFISHLFEFWKQRDYLAKIENAQRTLEAAGFRVTKKGE